MIAMKPTMMFWETICLNQSDPPNRQTLPLQSIKTENLEQFKSMENI